METSLEESNEVPLQKVQFAKKWTFWENYEMKEKDKTKKGDYTNLMKPILAIENIIQFWQFWNIYPGREPGNIFYNGERMI